MWSGRRGPFVSQDTVLFGLNLREIELLRPLDDVALTALAPRFTSLCFRFGETKSAASGPATVTAQSDGLFLTLSRRYFLDLLAPPPPSTPARSSPPRAAR
jgi:hypothetical protein